MQYLLQPVSVEEGSRIRLTESRKDKQEVRNTRMCANLAHVPADEEQQQLKRQNLKFNECFLEQKLGNDVKRIELFNGERHLTTNALEERHNRFARNVGKFRLNVF